uniref:Uncharacterized protein n=1 Tax=Arundo donax TaxID=35708 RepID=A0A0A9B3S0_ARUDO
MAVSSPLSYGPFQPSCSTSDRRRICASTAASLDHRRLKSPPHQACAASHQPPAQHLLKWAMELHHWLKSGCWMRRSAVPRASVHSRCSLDTSASS